MSRPIAAILGLALLFTLPATGHAQLGGLIKKAKDKVAPPAATQSTDQSARLPGPEITSEVVNKLLLAFKAEKNARDRAAAAEEERRRQASESQMDPQTRYYSCLTNAQENDSAMPEMKRLSKEGQDAADKGDQNKAMDVSMRMQPLMMQIHARAESVCVSVKPGAKQATPTQKAIQAAPVVPPEEAGAKEMGLSTVEYGQIKELIWTYLGYGKRAGLTESEKRAVDPKRNQLQEGFALVGMR